MSSFVCVCVCVCVCVREREREVGGKSPRRHLGQIDLNKIFFLFDPYVKELNKKFMMFTAIIIIYFVSHITELQLYAC